MSFFQMLSYSLNIIHVRQTISNVSTIHSSNYIVFPCLLISIWLKIDLPFPRDKMYAISSQTAIVRFSPCPDDALNRIKGKYHGQSIKRAVGKYPDSLPEYKQPVNKRINRVISRLRRPGSNSAGEKLSSIIDLSMFAWRMSERINCIVGIWKECASVSMW